MQGIPVSARLEPLKICIKTECAATDLFVVFHDLVKKQRNVATKQV